MTQQRHVEQEQTIDVGQGSDVYLESLNANGVKYVFINSGTDTFPIQESIAKYQSQGRHVPEVILCLDEEVAMSAGSWLLHGVRQAASAAGAWWTLALCRWAGPSTTPNAVERAWSSAPDALPTPSRASCPAVRA